MVEAWAPQEFEEAGDVRQQRLASAAGEAGLGSLPRRRRQAPEADGTEGEAAAGLTENSDQLPVCLFLPTAPFTITVKAHFECYFGHFIITVLRRIIVRCFQNILKCFVSFAGHLPVYVIPAYAFGWKYRLEFNETLAVVTYDNNFDLAYNKDLYFQLPSRLPDLHSQNPPKTSRMFREVCAA